MEFRTLLYRVDHRIATLTFNRPETHNALDESAVKDATAALGVASKDPAVKVVVLRATGPSFCSGMDPALLKKLLQGNLDDQQADAQRLALLLRTIHELRKPVVAVLEGSALSEGAGIIAASDFVLASDAARLGLPDVRSGAIAAVALVFVAKRVGEPHARALALSGREIDATEAHAIGLVNVVAPAAGVDAALDRLLATLVTANSSNAMALCKDLLSRIMGMNLAEALEFATNMHAASRMTADCRKGVTASLNGDSVEW